MSALEGLRQEDCLDSEAKDRPHRSRSGPASVFQLPSKTAAEDCPLSSHYDCCSISLANLVQCLDFLKNVYFKIER